MTYIDEQAQVRVGPQGRMVIPAKLRERLGIRPGQSLVARAEDGRLILESREAIIARLKSRARMIPSSVSLVDELLAERRAEARRERLE